MLKKFSFLLMAIALLLVSSDLSAQTIEKTFSHNLIIGQNPQSWEHRIDLPDSAAIDGKIFVSRELDLRLGKLVIVREEFTPTYYYVKVKLAKHVQLPMAGRLKVKLTLGKKQLESQVSAPTDLKLSPVGATLKPIFTWKTNARYAAITLYDLTAQKTIWERVSTTTGFKSFDEPYFLEMHEYLWAVKVSDKTGKYSKATQASFKIIKQNGVVIAVPR